MHPTHARDDDPPGERRVIVVGDNGLTLRFIKNLIERFGFHVIAIVPTGPGSQREEIRREARENRNLDILQPQRITPETIREAGLTDAYAVALMDQDDVGNLHLALKIREISHYLGDEELPRLIIRMYNRSLRDHVEKLLGNDGVYVLSDADMVSRTYTAAALGQIPPGPIAVWDRRLYLTRVPDERAESQWVVAAGEGYGVEMFPPGEDDAIRYLCLEPQRQRRWFRPVVAAWRTFAAGARQARHAVRRMLTESSWAVSAWLAVFLAGGMAVLLAVASGEDKNAVDGLWDALYMLALMAGGGIDPDTTEPWPLMVTHVVVVLAGVLLVPVLTSAIVDYRYALAEGRRVRAARDHVIVVGLGNMGTRVVERLRRQRIPVVAIERDRDAAGVQAARAAGAQVLIGDASRPETLQKAEIRYCRSLVAMVKGDSANLEAAMTGLECREDLRTVMRIYDPDFATLIRRNLNRGLSARDGAQNSSFSAPEVAAAAFTGALTDDEILETIPVRGHIAYIAEVLVEPGSPLDRAQAAEAARAGSHRLVAVKRATGRVGWNPDDGFRIAAGDRLLVITTRKGLNGIRRSCLPPAANPWGRRRPR